MQLTLTAKIRIYPTVEQAVLLDATMLKIKDALNFVSGYIFSNNCLNNRQLHDMLYYHLRTEYSLKSQIAESVIKTALSKYKSLKSNKHDFNLVDFKKYEYDLVYNRDYSLNSEMFSLNTLDKRIKVPYKATAMEKYFDGTYKFGTAKLVRKSHKYYIHIPMTKDYAEAFSFNNIVGVDLGINFLATSYDSNGKTTFYSGSEVKAKRVHYKLLRQELQRRKTSSARNRLKAIGQRENRYMTDINHQITKALIDRYGENTLFVLEDLTGIRSTTEKVRINNKYVSVSWAFYQFRTMLEYKASMHKCKVLVVEPKYTSQTCPKCGHTEKSNRSKKIHTFICKSCGYTSNDDRIGAMNLWSKGFEYLSKDAAGI